MQEPREQSLLIQEVTRQLLVLEEAIANVNQTRKQLKQRSVEMKSDIQMSVSRQLEMLKQHEASLLRQVDLIQQAKDAALQGQEDKLHEALGALTVALQVEEGQTTSPVRDVLQRLKGLKIKPMETPTLSLKPDSTCVNSPGSSCYGGLHFGGMFNSDASSASLPKLFEDYGDDEHHVLYRSIAESIGDCKKEISVTVPRLSQRPEDWLFMPTEDFIPPKPTTGPGHFLFPPFMSGCLKERLDKHNDMSRVSIHQWLCDIQGQADVEEEEADFDVLSSSAFLIQASSKDSSIEVLGADEATPVFTIGSLETSITSLNTAIPSLLSSTLQTSQNSAPSYFSQVMSAPTNSWLLSGHEAPPQTSAVYCHEVLRYFHEVSNDTKMWLQKYTEKKRMEDKTPSDDQADVSKVDMVKDSSETQTMSSDCDMWLLSRRELASEDNKNNKDEEKADVIGDGLHAIHTIAENQGTMCSASNASTKGVHGMPIAASCCMKADKCTSNCCSATSEPTVKDVQQEQATTSYFDFVLQQDIGSWLLVNEDVQLVNSEKKPCYQPVFTPFVSDANSNGCWLLECSELRVPPCSLDDLASAKTEDQCVTPSECDDVDSLTVLWKSRFRHDGSTCADEQNPFNSFETDKIFPVQYSVTKSNTDWLLTSVVESEASHHDQSKWLLCENSAEVDAAPEKVWLSLSDVSPSSKTFDSLQCFDNLFEYFRQSSGDSSSWLLTTSVVEE